MTEVLNVDSLPNRFVIFLESDLHIGSTASKDALIEHIANEVERCRHPAWLLGNGDDIEGITRDDKRFQRSDQGMTRPDPLLQYNHLIHMRKRLAKRPYPVWTQTSEGYAPIRDDDGTIHIKARKDNRLIGRGMGNHDEYVLKVGDFMPQHVCPTLGTPYLTYSSRINLNVQDGNTVKLFMWHGAGSPPHSNAKDPEQAEANVRAALALKIGKRYDDFHVGLMGHIHAVKAWRPRKQRRARIMGAQSVVDRPHDDTDMDISKLQGDIPINPYHRWYGITGTAKGLPPIGTSNWEEKMQFGAPELGYLELHYDHGLVRLVPRYWDESAGRLYE